MKTAVKRFGLAVGP